VESERSLRISAYPDQICEAAPVANGLCLARLGEEALQAHLSALRPDSSVDASGVVFTTDLLNRLLDATRQGQQPELGVADFTGETFPDNADFTGMTFTEGASFGDATFTQDANSGNATFTEGAYFTGATRTGSPASRSGTAGRKARPGRTVRGHGRPRHVPHGPPAAPSVSAQWRD
jgi:hypothetical protein